jgi:hypothetical protein
VTGTWEERIGRVAYETYRRELADAVPLVEWEALPERAQRAWGKVATAVVHKASEANPREDRMK